MDLDKEYKDSNLTDRTTKSTQLNNKKLVKRQLPEDDSSFRENCLYHFQVDWENHPRNNAEISVYDNLASMFVDITPDDVEQCIMGLCDQLAKDLADKTDLKIVGIFTTDERHMVHAGVEIFDGYILDVEGIYAKDDWLNRWLGVGWEEDELKILSEEEFDEEFLEVFSLKINPYINEISEIILKQLLEFA